MQEIDTQSLVLGVREATPKGTEGITHSGKAHRATEVRSTGASVQSTHQPDRIRKAWGPALKTSNLMLDYPIELWRDLTYQRTLLPTRQADLQHPNADVHNVYRAPSDRLPRSRESIGTRLLATMFSRRHGQQQYGTTLVSVLCPQASTTAALTISAP